MTTSPRISRPFGLWIFWSNSADKESGTLRMVRMFEVTSSPVWPSPRVMPVTRRAPPSSDAS